MKKQTKIILTSTIIILLAGGVFGVHETLLQQAKHEMNQAKTTLNAEQSKLSKAQNIILADEHSASSNLKGSFPNTQFQKQEEVVLPLQANYKPNHVEISKWIATYINELRKLNQINSNVSWNATSGEQTFIDGLAAAFSGNTTNQTLHIANPNQYSFASYGGGLIGGATPSAGTSESDQETAYNIVMNLYDQSSAKSVANNERDANSRTYLLYSGKNIGVNVGSGLVSFDFNPSDAASKRSEALNAVPLPDITFDYVDMTTYKKENNVVNQEKSKVAQANDAYQKAKNKVNTIETYFF